MTGFNKFIEKSMFRKEFTGFGYTDIKLLISSTPTISLTFICYTFYI